jgi:hypothetical protein
MKTRARSYLIDSTTRTSAGSKAGTSAMENENDGGKLNHAHPSSDQLSTKSQMHQDGMQTRDNPSVLTNTSNVTARAELWHLLTKGWHGAKVVQIVPDILTDIGDDSVCEADFVDDADDVDECLDDVDDMSESTYLYHHNTTVVIDQHKPTVLNQDTTAVKEGECCQCRFIFLLQICHLVQSIIFFK